MSKGILTGLILLLSGSCLFEKEPYFTNPNFELLLRNEKHRFINPILSPDGNLLYYIDDTRSDPRTNPTELKGGIYVYSFSDRNQRLLYEGTVSDIDLSPDGTKLLAGFRDQYYPSLYSYVLLIDTSGNVLDSMSVNYDDISFNAAGDGMIFSRIEWNELYRAFHTYFYLKRFGNDTGTTAIYAIPSGDCRFDVFDGDSIYARGGVWAPKSPAVNPCDYRWAIFPIHVKSFISYSWVWRIHDRSADTVFYWESGQPYRLGSVGWPNWSRDGKDIVFSAWGQPSTIEIWRLKNALQELQKERR